MNPRNNAIVLLGAILKRFKEVGFDPIRLDCMYLKDLDVANDSIIVHYDPSTNEYIIKLEENK